MEIGSVWFITHGLIFYKGKVQLLTTFPFSLFSHSLTPDFPTPTTKPKFSYLFDEVT